MFMDTPVKIINNITETVKNDLVVTLKKGSIIVKRTGK